VDEINKDVRATAKQVARVQAQLEAARANLARVDGTRVAQIEAALAAAQANTARLTQLKDESTARIAALRAKLVAA